MNKKPNSSIYERFICFLNTLKSSISFGLSFIFLFSSCLSQRPIFTDEKTITNEVKSVTPQWQEYKGAPFISTGLGLMAGAAAVGWAMGDDVLANNPENNPNDNELLTAIGFGVGTLLVYDAVFFGKKRKESIKKPITVEPTEFKKWLRKYNAKTDERYVALNETDENLLLIRSRHLAAYNNYKNKVISLSTELDTDEEVMPGREDEITVLLSDERGKLYPEEVDALKRAKLGQERIVLENRRKVIFIELEAFLNTNQNSPLSYESVVQLGQFENQHSSKLRLLDQVRRNPLQEKAREGFNRGLETLLEQEINYLKSVDPKYSNWEKLEAWYSKFEGQYERPSLFKNKENIQSLKQEYLKIRKATVMASRFAILREMNAEASFLNTEKVKSKYLHLISEDEQVSQLLDRLALRSKQSLLENNADESTANIFTNLLQSQAISSKDLLAKIKTVKLDFDVSTTYLNKAEVIRMLSRKGISVSDEADVVLWLTDLKEYNKFTQSREGKEVYSSDLIATIIYAQLYTRGLKYYNGEISSGLTFINSVSRSYLVKDNELSRIRNGYTVSMNNLLGDVFTKPFTTYSATPEKQWSKSIESIFENASSFEFGEYASISSYSWINSLQRIGSSDYSWQSNLQKLGIKFNKQDAFGIENPLIFHRLNSSGYNITDDSEREAYVIAGDANIILKDCLMKLNGEWYRYPGSVYSHRRYRICVKDEIETSKKSLTNEAIEDFTVKYLKN